MAHLHHFIGDLAIILITASIATLLFKWLKQPIVLGYILAGFIAGQHITWLPTVTDIGNVEIWAEIGVIFLLFALGLEFSFKRLIAVGGTASLATLINLGSMIIIGYLLGKFLGWSDMDSIFLGGMLSMSSTTIIIKAFNDMGLQKQRFAGIVFGMLIVEDLIAILMMVLLSTVAVSNVIEGSTLLNSILRLGFFVLIWFIVGIYLIPTILKKLKNYLNDETLLIIAVGLCLGMVLFATRVGFSAALGAFIMGSILAESIMVKRIEHLIEPIKNLFGAVFFVSVGMMLNPHVIVDNIGLIAILVVVVLIGRIFFATIGVLASGEGLKVALQAGFSLAQIGEFSFIIATLGTSLGVISDKLYPLIVAVSIITTFTTPYCIKVSIPVFHFITKYIPARWHKLINGYAASSYDTVNTQNDWNKLLKSVLMLTAVYFTLSLAITYLCELYTTPFITRHLPGVSGKVIAAALTLLLMSPFLRAMMMRQNRSAEFKNLWNDNHFNRGMLISLIAFRIGFSMLLVLMVLIPLFPDWTVLMIIIGLTVITLILFAQGFKTHSNKIEAHFLENLNYRQIMEEQNAPISSVITHHLKSKEIHIEEIEISPNSPKIGKTLHELNFRGRTGINIVSIIRGHKKINIPDANERIYPYDKLILAGADDDIQKLIRSIEERKKSKQAIDEEASGSRISLSQYVIEHDSPLIGKNIAQLHLQKKVECMIICIDRGNSTVTQFSSDFVLAQGDTLLLAGEKNMLKSFNENMHIHP